MKLKTIKYRNIWEEAGIVYEGVYWNTLEEAKSTAENDLEWDAHWGGELRLLRTEKVTMPLFGKHKIEVIDDRGIQVKNRLFDIFTTLFFFPILFPTFVMVGSYDGAVKYFKAFKMWIR